MGFVTFPPAKPPAFYQAYDALFIEAARLCARQVSKQDRRRGKLYPSQAGIVSTEIAIASGLVRYLFKEKQAGVKEPENIDRWMQDIIWQPHD